MSLSLSFQVTLHTSKFLQFGHKILCSFTTPHSLPFPTKIRHCHHRSPHQHHPLKLGAIDAAQPYDSKISSNFTQSTKLKIAVIGFSNYGQFIAIAFIRRGHTVLAHSDLCERHPDVILVCTSIMSTKQVLTSLPMLRLKRSTLFGDVLSVKEFPKNLFIEYLPKHYPIFGVKSLWSSTLKSIGNRGSSSRFYILTRENINFGCGTCILTFGPKSGKDSWRGLPFMYDMVRIEDNELSRERVERFLEIFDKEGCRMVEMPCAEHDKYAAWSQFITHTMGRVLEKMDLRTTPINTKGYEMLLELVENTSSDSFDLYYGLFMYNEKAMEELRRLGGAFEELQMELFGDLHEANRNHHSSVVSNSGERDDWEVQIEGKRGCIFPFFYK